LEKARARKQIMVRTSPNSKFVDISKIRRTQLDTREARPEDKDKEEANESKYTVDCILIR
jgi:hypothetical protein